MDIYDEVRYVKGVGDKRAIELKTLGIYSVGDLISYYPRAYEDRTNIIKIVEAQDEEKCCIEARPITHVFSKSLGRNRSIQKVSVSDGSERCDITFFNQPYLTTMIKMDGKYRFYGKMSVKRSKYSMTSPVFDKIEESKNTGIIIPTYPLNANIKQTAFRKIIRAALDKLPYLEEELPEYIIKEYKLLDYDKATRQIHFPDSFKDFEHARDRLVFDELLAMQLGLLKLKGENNSEVKGIKYDKNVEMSDVINQLDYKLTNAQLKVLEEINKDMEDIKPMNRLLQGDVGSGKTIVSIIAAYKAVKSSYQVAMLAPTMILAKQHLANYEKELSKFGIKCILLVGGMTKKQKDEALEKIASGEVDIVIGTHAVLTDDVVFNKLGLVITDEQHRFGVRQRAVIASKGENPDVLVMSATPIPRTLALILYGDLDVSIIDELPPNRKKIETIAVSKAMENKVNLFIENELKKGRQAYVVCPLVEETENTDSMVKNVNDLGKKYKEEIFKDFKVEILHGKMKSKEKDEIMQRFKDGKIDVLVSTTVIEVGIDVKNASIMVIENAERFGLAQLHQLRGRVGRGEYNSYCILKFAKYNENIKERMEIMVKTNNGMLVAKKDLELRGSGDFFGTAQHGLPEFKIANLFQDTEMLQGVQALAIEIIAKDPKLESEENKKLKELVGQKFRTKSEITI